MNQLAAWMKDHHSAILATIVLIKLVPGIPSGLANGVVAFLQALTGA